MATQLAGFKVITEDGADSTLLRAATAGAPQWRDASSQFNEEVRT
jgi:hypothetical protein